MNIKITYKFLHFYESYRTETREINKLKVINIVQLDYKLKYHKNIIHYTFNTNISMHGAYLDM